MATPARTRSATMSACKSEKASTRSGSSARIFGMSAEMNADTRGFSRRAHRIAGDADDAVLLADQIERLHGLLGEADDAAGREVGHGATMQEPSRIVTGALSPRPLPPTSLPP